MTITTNVTILKKRNNLEFQWNDLNWASIIAQFILIQVLCGMKSQPIAICKLFQKQYK